MSGPQPDEPNYLVLIAPGAASDDPTPAWTDVSGALRSVLVIRGADKHLDQDQPGTATIVVDNWDGTFDNDNTASPYAGLLVTDMRLRVLAEWDGDLYERFNGYLDDIELEYPDDGEAWAVLRATDAFKVLAGAELASSAYATEVIADSPALWWRLGDPDTGTTAWDASGNHRDGTATGAVTFGADSLTVNDEDGAATFTEAGTTFIGPGKVTLDSTTPWAVELWFRMPADPAFIQLILTGAAGAAFGAVNYLALQLNNVTRLLGVQVGNDAGTIYQANPPTALNANQTYHIVVTHAADRVLRVYVDGALAVTGDTTAGTFSITDFYLGSPHGQAAPNAVIDEVAVYTGTIPSAGRIADHNTAGRTPWDGDTPAQRAGRVLDAIGWPAALRDLETGESTLQSATLAMTALDHLLKVAASEFGELHVTKEGAIKLVARRSLVNRARLAALGPATDETRYRSIRFSSGADLVRNPVTVSRAGGVAQTVEAARTYYPHQFTLDGLYHDSDVLSRSAAEFILSEFKDQKRRIAGVTFGPFDAERLADWFPLLLDAELGDVYQATFHPPNGDDVVQVSVLEGTSESWAADTGIGEIGWSLSRAYAGGGAFWQLGVAGASELGVTTRLYF